MKKTMIIIIVLVLGLQLKAQDAFSPSGNFSIDLNFNPAAIFDANAGSMFVMPFIKARYFISSKSALRLGFTAEFDSDKEYFDINGDNFTKTKSASLVIAPGFEQQFGAKRFYFYLGGEIPFKTYTSKQISEYAGNTTETKNHNGGYFSAGINLILGFDFYILPNFYIGAEFTPGFSLVKDYDVTVDNNVTTKGGVGTSFGLSSASGLRLGARF